MPLPPGARVGTLPDGTLTWLDANGQPIDQDGNPRTDVGAAKPLAPAPNTAVNTSPIGSLPNPLNTSTTPAPAVAPSTTPAVGGPGAVQVPQGSNIDPNAGAPSPAPAPPTPTQTAQNASATAGQTPPSVGAAQGPTGLFTVDQTTAAAAKEVQDANINTAAIWDQINKQQALVDRYTSGDLASQAIANPQTLASATNTLNTLYSSLSSAQQRVETANAAYSTSLTNAIKANQVDPSSVALAQAQADAAKSNADTAARQVQVLEDGAPTQRALVSAQAGQAAATAAASQASADATKAKTPAEVAQLTAQANALNAQATQTATLLPGLVAKQNADTTLTTAQAGLTDANSDLARANTAKVQSDTKLVDVQTQTAQSSLAAGQPQANVAATQAQAAANNANAQAAIEATKQKQLGPLYGLQQQIAEYGNVVQAVKNQIFGPGGSGDPEHANQLLQQYVDATIGGTTPYAASVAVQNAQQNQFGTQAAMWNQSSQSAAARANAFAGTAGSALGSMLQANQWMPRGSTAMGDAFNYFLDQMKGNMGGPQAFTPPPQPTPPPMPALLQGFAAGHAAGTAQAQQANAGQGQGQAAPTVNINVNGQPQTGTTLPFTGPPAQVPSNPGPGQNAVAGQVPQGTLLSGGAQPQPQQSPQDAFAQGLANNAPGPMPNYLSSLVDPLSMLRTGRGLQSLYNQGPGAGTPAAGSLFY